MYVLVLLAIVGKDEVLQRHLYSDPLLVSECGPDVVGLSDRGLVWLQNHLERNEVDRERRAEEEREGEEREDR